MLISSSSLALLMAAACAARWSWYTCWLTMNEVLSSLKSSWAEELM